MGSKNHFQPQLVYFYPAKILQNEKTYCNYSAYWFCINAGFFLHEHRQTGLSYQCWFQ